VDVPFVVWPVEFVLVPVDVEEEDDEVDPEVAVINDVVEDWEVVEEVWVADGDSKSTAAATAAIIMMTTTTTATAIVEMDF
jgi:hypothetical protein